MIYQEKKTIQFIPKIPEVKEIAIKDINNSFIKHNWEYKCEDLFGEATITSIDRLDGDTLDELVFDIIIAKQLKKGHTPNYEIVFEATFKPQWEEKEDIEVEIRTTKKKNWFINLLTKIKNYVSS